MTLRHALPLAISLALASGFATTAAADAPAAQAQAANPFFQPSPLDWHLPQFDKIRNSDYLPAFERGMADQRREIDAIANNKAKPTFDNTIVAMERSGQLLNRVSAVFFNLTGANTNDELEALQTVVAPKLSAHSDAINLNGKLFARVKSLYDRRASLGLNPEQLRLLERYHTDFVRAGAQLSDADKEKLKTLNSELASLGTTFSQNVLKEVNDSGIVVDTRAELAGMTDPAIAAAAKAAETEIENATKALADASAALAAAPADQKADAEKALADAQAAADRAAGMKGKFLIKLLNTSGQPALDSLTNRALRERIMRASLARGSRGNAWDNTGVVTRIARLRAERANLLGYPDHATYVLEDETALTPEAVNKMMAGLAPAAVANARREAAAIQRVIDAEGGHFQVQPWDWAFYAEKVRKAKYNFDESQLKPYFEMKHVLEDGVFYAAHELYGISFKQRTDLPVYDPDVLVYEVTDKDGKPLALFLADYYARSNKRGGAWMNEYVSQSALMGTKSVVANHLNIPKPPAGEPTLLTWDEVTTAFHEFGHALHGMFSNVGYPRFSGTNVPRDFVEYPSQVNEMWADWPSVLQHYAKHYQTGAPMPQELLDKVQAAAKFNQGYATTEYLAAALLDQRWHQLKPDQVPDAAHAMEFEAKALHDLGVDFAPVPPRYRTPYFSHIWGGGYSAGYYAYLWSEVLDADSVEWFKQNGGLTRANGDHFRDTLLSRGGSGDAVGLFRSFTGREPYVEPLLKRRGLDAAPEADDTAQPEGDKPAEPKQD